MGGRKQRSDPMAELAGVCDPDPGVEISIRRSIISNNSLWL